MSIRFSEDISFALLLYVLVYQVPIYREQKDHEEQLYTTMYKHFIVKIW